MEENEITILALLKSNPGKTYISESGKELYVLLPGESMMIRLSGPDFNAMSDEEINLYIQRVAQQFNK